MLSASVPAAILLSKCHVSLTSCEQVSCCPENPKSSLQTPLKPFLTLLCFIKEFRTAGSTFSSISHWTTLFGLLCVDVIALGGKDSASPNDAKKSFLLTAHALTMKWPWYYPLHVFTTAGAFLHPSRWHFRISSWIIKVVWHVSLCGIWYCGNTDTHVRTQDNTIWISWTVSFRISHQLYVNLKPSSPTSLKLYAPVPSSSPLLHLPQRNWVHLTRGFRAGT